MCLADCYTGCCNTTTITCVFAGTLWHALIAGCAAAAPPTHAAAVRPCPHLPYAVVRPRKPCQCLQAHQVVVMVQLTVLQARQRNLHLAHRTGHDRAGQYSTTTHSTHLQPLRWQLPSNANQLLRCLLVSQRCDTTLAVLQLLHCARARALPCQRRRSWPPAGAHLSRLQVGSLQGQAVVVQGAQHIHGLRVEVRLC